MPSHRDHEQDRTDSHSRERERSRSPDRSHSLPPGVSLISESDYFLKNTEFRLWLKEEKSKYFDELSSDRARSYFRKFVKAWNRGKLPDSIYNNVDSVASSATNQTAYKWSFASKGSVVDAKALNAVREEVGSATYGRDSRSQGASSSGRVHGPTLPSSSDLVLARESASEYQAAERDHKRKRDRAEAKERVEEMVGPKPVGREGMLEKKRARRENDRAFREKGDDGFEADESTLLGGGDSFRDHIARRDAARKRFEEKRGKDEKIAATRERSAAIREKDKATMDMFQQLAKQRFG
ncbi:hypothetical protein BV22DRAFT_1008149 [Leucogyrophana mollusca]|uniref:Uncharacterized protein n=1 Tax=Leucogyrophana mollusca TaxID=85980 RepID=A0ACB8BLT7_9AGAM|nr:hypothetical protein BV22DRAFT_1008149 [Leucogyrophana mollusca]